MKNKISKLLIIMFMLISTLGFIKLTYDNAEVVYGANSGTYSSGGFTYTWSYTNEFQNLYRITVKSKTGQVAIERTDVTCENVDTEIDRAVASGTGGTSGQYHMYRALVTGLQNFKNDKCGVACTPQVGSWNPEGTVYDGAGRPHNAIAIRSGANGTGDPLFCLDPNIQMNKNNNCQENYLPVQLLRDYQALDEIAKTINAFQVGGGSLALQRQAQVVIWEALTHEKWSGLDTSQIKHIMANLDNDNYRVYNVKFSTNGIYKMNDTFVLENTGNGDFSSDKYVIAGTTNGITATKTGNAITNTITQPYPLVKEVNINGAGKGQVKYLNNDAYIKLYPVKDGIRAQKFAYFGSYVNNTYQEEWADASYRLNLKTGSIFFQKKDSFGNNVYANYCQDTGLCVVASGDATNNTFRLLIDENSPYYNTNADTGTEVVVNGTTYHVFKLENGETSWKTNTNGQITINNVLLGDFYLQETSVDENVFILNEELIKVSVTEDNSTANPVNVEMKNINLFGDLEIQKLDEFGNKGILNTYTTDASGNQFKLKYVDTLGKDLFSGKTFNLPDGVVSINADDKYLYIDGNSVFTTDKNGYIHLGEKFVSTRNLCVPFGNWKLEEIKVQNEYELSTKIIDVSVEVGEKTHTDFTNDYRRVKLKLFKQDKYDEEMVEGATYTLFDIDRFNIGDINKGIGNLYAGTDKEIFNSGNVGDTKNFYDTFVSPNGFTDFNYIYDFVVDGKQATDKYLELSANDEFITSIASGKTTVKVSQKVLSLYGTLQDRYYYIGNHTFDPYEDFNFYLDEAGTIPINIRTKEYSIKRISAPEEDIASLNDMWDIEGKYEITYTIVDEAHHKWTFTRFVTYEDDHGRVCEYNAVLKQYVWGDTKEVCKEIEDENPEVKKAPEEYDYTNRVDTYDRTIIVQKVVSDDTVTEVGEFVIYTVDKNKKPDLKELADVDNVYRLGTYTTDDKGEAIIDGLLHSRTYLVCEDELPKHFTYDETENVCFVIRTNYATGVVQKVNTKNNELTEPMIKTTATYEDGTKTISWVDNLEVVIVDTVKYMGFKDLIGKDFTLKGTLISKKTGEVVATANDITFTVNEPKGTVDMTFRFSPENLTNDYVVYEELYDVNGELVAYHKDIDDTKQTVSVEGTPHIKTTLVDSADKDKVVTNIQNVKVVDTVSYSNFVVGREYVLNGELVKKSDGIVLATATTTFTPVETDGVVELEFTFDASLLAGDSVVAFETAQFNNQDYAIHRDIDDEDQTVKVIRKELIFATVVSNHDIHIYQYNTMVNFTDTVKYENLDTDKVYMMRGYFVNKNTGTPVSLNGSVVEGYKIFKPTSANDTVEVEFNFNGALDEHNWLDDGTYVVYEELYEVKLKDINGNLDLDNVDSKELLNEHKQIDNLDETFTFTDDYRTYRFKKKRTPKVPKTETFMY